MSAIGCYLNDDTLLAAITIVFTNAILVSINTRKYFYLRARVTILLHATQLEVLLSVVVVVA